MRKGEKAKCEEILSTLGEAHAAVFKSIREMRLPDAVALLMQCQQLAISMGGMIERSEGEGNAAVPVLEQYCELLYHISEDLAKAPSPGTSSTGSPAEGRKESGNADEDGAGESAEDAAGENEANAAGGAAGHAPEDVSAPGNASDLGSTEDPAAEGEDAHGRGAAIWARLREEERGRGTDYGRELREALWKIRGALDSLPIRYEAVFLPYQASMWDSMESVWRAADGDPDCDVYVIPIPYYDKNPDGSFREKYYDFDKYPPDVKVTDYRSYNLKERHPDFIFIHNPYDDNNYVTTIEPFFYSAHIKQYTDMLVYIPYFVLDEITDRSEETLDWMEHFVIMPGVLNADLVIVQSEGMKQLYLDVLCRSFGEEMRSAWEGKILGLGSPKFDKALGSKRQDVDIPAAWRKYLYKPDGIRKKVILYNTGVGGMLEQEEKMLRKMRDVFRVFQENAADVCLLWRPHPLLRATLSSMRPQLLTEYERLVQWYKEHEVGIFDETSDLDRALALSDAYYGDGSSVVQLCRKMGLPVMIQNVDILEDDGEDEEEERQLS